MQHLIRTPRLYPRARVLLVLVAALAAACFAFAATPAYAAVGGTVSGTVTDVDTSAFIAGARVEIWQYDADYSVWSQVGLELTDSLGHYAHPVAADGYYDVNVTARPAYADSLFPQVDPAAGQWVAGGATLTRNAQLSPLAPAITGRLRTSDGSAFADADVVLYKYYGSTTDSQTPYWAEIQRTSPLADGRWAFYSVPGDTYHIGFLPHSRAYLAEYYSNAATVGAGTDVAYLPPAVTSGIDATLAAAPRAIAGTVTVAGGAPVAGCFVDVYRLEESVIETGVFEWTPVVPDGQTLTAADGSYAFYSLPEDTYRVGFSKAGLGTQFYNGQASLASADDIVYSGTPRTGISAVLGSYAPDAFEPDDDALGARPIVVGAVAQTHTIAPALDADWVSFDATAGVSYTLETTASGGSGTDTLLELYDEDGVTLLGSDDNGNGAGFSRLEYAAPASGRLYARVRGALVGTVGAYALRVTAAPDTAPPSVIADAQDSYVGTATITISAVDARSGIAYVAYRLDTGTTQTVSASSTVVQVPAVGEHTLAYWAADTSGNVSDASHATFTITAEEPPPVPDTTPPAVSTDASASYIGTATILVSAVDTDSGVFSVSYRLDSETTVTVLGDQATVVAYVGEHVLYSRATDASGNVSPVRVDAFTVIADEPPPPPADTTPPSVTASVAASSVGTATVRLSATDASSAVTAVSWRLDGGTTQTVEASQTTFTVTGVGEHTLLFSATDAAGNQAPAQTVSFTVTASPPADLETLQLAGSTRFDTAILAAQLAYPAGLDPGGWRTVVIATGANWPDALGGATLAGALDGPILLTAPGSLSAGVATEIGRLGATKAVILGGTGAVSPAVESQLKSLLGSANVERIGGSNRYQTAEAVAIRAKSLVGWGWDGTVLVATGSAFPDALAAAPLAAGFGWPLLLEAPGGLTDASKAFVADGASAAVVLGGTGAVSPATEAWLKGSLGAQGVERLAGTTRYLTAALIAQYGVAQGFGWNGVAIATGQNFPDALAGGVLQGVRGSVMLLTPTDYLDPSPEAMLSANRDSIDNVTYLGGDGAVSPAVRSQVEAVLRP